MVVMIGGRLRPKVALGSSEEPPVPLPPCGSSLKSLAPVIPPARGAISPLTDLGHLLGLSSNVITFKEARPD